MTSIMSEMVAFLIFVIFSQTWKLILDRVIHANRFNFPSAPLNSVVSSLESGWWCCLYCSGQIGIRLMVLIIDSDQVWLRSHFLLFCTDFEGTFKLFYNAWELFISILECIVYKTCDNANSFVFFSQNEMEMEIWKWKSNIWSALYCFNL